MAIKVQVPASEVLFPQKCACCGDPTVFKTVPIRRLTQAAQARQSTGYIIGGTIGAAIAGATGGGEKYVTMGIPHCQACDSRSRNLQIAGWVCLALSLLSFLALPVVITGSSNDDAMTWMGLLPWLGLGLLLASPILFAVRSSRQPVRILKVQDVVGGAELAFRNAEYLDDFLRLNMRSMVPYTLRAGRPLPVPLEQALAVVTESIVEDRPELPSNLGGYFYRGQIYMQMQLYGQAVDDLSRVIAAGAANPYQTSAYFLRGKAYMNLSRYIEAVADLTTFTQISSDRRQVGEAKRLLKQLALYA